MPSLGFPRGGRGGDRAGAHLGGGVGRLFGAAFRDQDRRHRPVPRRSAVGSAGVRFHEDFPAAGRPRRRRCADPGTRRGGDRQAGRRACAARPTRFRAVRQPDSGDFFAQNGLLFLPTDEVARVAGGLLAAPRSVLATLAPIRACAGSLGALSFGLMGVDAGGIEARRPGPADEHGRRHGRTRCWPASRRASRGAPLASGQPPEPRELRHFIEVEPVLDFSALQPGRAATEAIAQTAQRSEPRRRVSGAGAPDRPACRSNDDRIRDDQRPCGAQRRDVAGARCSHPVAGACARARIILAGRDQHRRGLAISAALGLLLVGALNLISVAFFVLVRRPRRRFRHPVQRALPRRAPRYRRPAPGAGQRRAQGRRAAWRSPPRRPRSGSPRFCRPTIAGSPSSARSPAPGMIIAFLTSITLLPALLAVLNPPGEPRPMGFAALAPVDRFLAAAAASRSSLLTLASWCWRARRCCSMLPFDFNPLHLQNPNVRSRSRPISSCASDPQTGANAIEIVKPDLAAARCAAQRWSRLAAGRRRRGRCSNFVPGRPGRRNSG